MGPNEISEIVRFRSASDADVSEVALGHASPDLLVGAYPWREFRWRRGQRHYSGTYWSSTERDHVVYESRLELTRLLFADFNRDVQRICAQPFLIESKRDGVTRRHVPDYLLLTISGPVVVDVKPKGRLHEPKVAATLNWTRDAIEQRGWQYEVWTEPNELELRNIRFLAGYRRDFLFDPSLLNLIREVEPYNLTLDELIGQIDQVPRALVKSAVLHMVWMHELSVDIARPLLRSSPVRKG